MGTKKPEIAFRERVAFAAGDTGFNFVWQTIELYLLFYYVRILGLPPKTAALIFLAGAVVDLVADPLIGALVDRSRMKIPSRGWMLVAGPPLGIALGLAFLAPPSFGTLGLCFIALCHIALRVTYSLGNIPYATLTARITDNPAEQVRLTGSRMQGAAVGGFIAATVYFLLPLHYQVSGVPLGAILLGIAAQPLFFLTWRGVKERVTPANPPDSTIGAQLKGMAVLLARSDALRRLLLLIFFAGIACTILYKGLLFVFDELDARGWGYGAALFPSIILFIGAPMWTKLATAIGRASVMRLSSVIYLVAVASAWLAGSNLTLVTILIAIAAFASVGMSVMFFAFVPGVIDACERELATDGCAARVFGMANLARKLAQAVAPQVIALSLVLPGETVMRAMVITAFGAVVASVWLVPKEGQLRPVTSA